MKIRSKNPRPQPAPATTARAGYDRVLTEMARGLRRAATTPEPRPKPSQHPAG